MKYELTGLKIYFQGSLFAEAEDINEVNEILEGTMMPGDTLVIDGVSIDSKLYFDKVKRERNRAVRIAPGPNIKELSNPWTYFGSDAVVIYLCCGSIEGNMHKGHTEEILPPNDKAKRLIATKIRQNGRKTGDMNTVEFYDFKPIQIVGDEGKMKVYAAMDREEWFNPPEVKKVKEALEMVKTMALDNLDVDHYVIIGEDYAFDPDVKELADSLPGGVTLINAR